MDWPILALTSPVALSLLDQISVQCFVHALAVLSFVTRMNAIDPQSYFLLMCLRKLLSEFLYRFCTGCSCQDGIYVFFPALVNNSKIKGETTFIIIFFVCFFQGLLCGACTIGCIALCKRLVSQFDWHGCFGWLMLSFTYIRQSNIPSVGFSAIKRNLEQSDWVIELDHVFFVFFWY